MSQNELFGSPETAEQACIPRVLNKYRHGVPDGAIYIGRPSRWGNPFVIGKDGDRAAVIAKYRAWLLANPEMVATAKRDLAGKDLVCFCSPAPCHGDVLLEVANGLKMPEGGA